MARVFFVQLKRISFGEFFDDLRIFDKIYEELGIEDYFSSTDSADIEVGEDRLGNTDILKRFGLT